MMPLSLLAGRTVAMFSLNNDHMMFLFVSANDSVTLPSNNMYPSTTEHEVQPSPMGFHTSDGLPYSSNPGK